ncbi:MAG: hypothetical protein K5986_03840 [Clostridium sp.]|nr:hypothetical protein [Clostridium sp.]
MNKLQHKITKYNMLCGLFMSLIIGLIFNLQIAAIFLLGIAIGLLSYISRVIVVKKWIGKGTIRILTTTFLRIFVIVGIVIPIMYDLKLVAAYLAGFIMHFLVEGFCLKI